MNAQLGKGELEIAQQKIRVLEEALKAAQDYTRSIIDSSLDMIIAVDMNRRIIEFNRAAQVSFGYHPQEVLGEHVDLLYADPQQGQAIHQTTLENGRCVREILNQRKNGQVFKSFLSASVMRNVQGELVGVMGVSRDVTERVWREEALRLLSLAVAQSREGIAVSDLEGRLMYANDAFAEAHGYRSEDVIGQHLSIFHTPEQLHAVEAANQQIRETGEFDGEIWHARSDGTVFPGLMRNSLLRDEAGEPIGLIGTLRDITERKEIEESLRRRNLELALINHASQAFGSILDMDQMLASVLEQTRHLLGVVACSIWLTDLETGELVCRQATGPESEVVRGWRLAVGEGLVGWVAQHGESLIVPDTWNDPRHFKGVDEQTRLPLRSIISVPLRVTDSVTGVLQAVDKEVDYFRPADLELLEPLAVTAAIAIENARLYEQTRQDAETKSVLLREVNHRVMNNLSAIIGLLYTARRHAMVKDQRTFNTTMNELIGRVRGLSTVHSMLSASEWSPLRLSDLITQVIRGSLQALPRDKHLSIDVSPSPVCVTSDQAHNLALIINELTTNAVKYALGERDTVAITVRIDLDDGDDPGVCLEFRDDGPGYPEDVLQLERRNVGFDLIQSIVRDSLRGDLSLHNDGGGVAIIRFGVGETEIGNSA